MEDVKPGIVSALNFFAGLILLATFIIFIIEMKEGMPIVAAIYAASGIFF